jgi:spore germination protein GerM
LKKRTSNTKGILLIAFLVFAVVLSLLVFRKYEAATRTAAAPGNSAPAGSAVVTLFFASPDGRGLVREGREVEIDENVEDGIESVVDELISGPVGDHAVTLPANTRVLGVQVNGNVAQIDFGSEIKDGIPSATAARKAAVYSVVDTVAANFPQIKAVQFLVEGAPVDSFGEVNLKEPVRPDYTLEQKEQPVSPPAEKKGT